LKTNFPSDAETLGVDLVGNLELCAYTDNDCSVWSKNKWPYQILKWFLTLSHS